MKFFQVVQGLSVDYLMTKVCIEIWKVTKELITYRKFLYLMTKVNIVKIENCKMTKVYKEKFLSD